ncbi:MAG: LLM class flavin-dependent oxidoreductase [Dehalococcoidia bacterium]
MAITPHFGALVPHIKRPWQQTREAALAFEVMGYDSLWVNDHLYAPTDPAVPVLEAWTTAAALGAITERVEIGTLVTPIGLRNIGHLAKLVATVDQITGGRVIAGVGAGWLEREFTDFGVPFLTPRDRLGQLGEGIEVLRRLWGPEASVTHHGRYFDLDDAVVSPKPARPPRILVGGGGERVTMRLAAQHADIWNNLPHDQHRIAHKVDVLRRHCADIGRDAEEVTVSQMCLVTIDRDEARAREQAATATRIFRGYLGDPEGPLALSGTPAQVAARVQQHIDAGCTMFQFEFFGVDPREGAALFAEEVMPQFR